MNSNVARVVLAGTNSGCGKTTVTCAVLQALVDRGLKTGAFKCGPDYIDPMFHSRIIGAESRNLDGFFFSENTLRYLMAKHGAGRDVSIIEGVMGLYDGRETASAVGSTWDMARITESPVVLVVGARGVALSALAVVQGFLDLCPDSGVRGVIFNQCSGAVYDVLAQEMEKRFGKRVRPLGYLPRMPECGLESRHLGLVTAAEVKDLREKTERLAARAAETIDLEGLLDIARSAPPVAWEAPVLPRGGETVRIAVARDQAFCFYYEDSLDVLREMGAELVPFSPLRDTALPENVQGLYLGGGYPELYAGTLSENRTMRESIRASLAAGLPCIAECGGFMYLTEAIGEYPMVGALPGRCFDTGKLTRFGYVTLTAEGDTMLCRRGETIAGHEFHHWDCTENGKDFTARKLSGRSWQCVQGTKTLYAGFPHFHFLANPGFAAGFYNACVKEKHGHAGKL